MDKIVLTLSLDDVNYLLGILAEKPYKEVFQLVAEIQSQGNEQVDGNK